MAFTAIRTAVAQGVMTITLARPDRLNAFTSVMHAELKIGDTKIYLGDENPEMGAKSPQALGGSPVSLNIYTEDCDAMFKKAIAAGATVKMPLDNMFWGDRYGKITDPFGHEWGIATHVEDVSETEMEKRGREWFATMAKK